jgi:hypothetical protein
MADPAQWFASGGEMMPIVLLLDVVGLVAVAVAWLLALVARVRGRTGVLVKTFPALVLMGSFLPVLVGAVGYLQLRGAAGHSALAPLRFGGVSTVLLGGLAVLALVIAPWSARRR